MPRRPEVKIDCYFVKIRESRRGKAKTDKTEYLKFEELPGRNQSIDGDDSKTDFVKLFQDYVASIDSNFVLNTSNDLAFNIPVSEIKLLNDRRAVLGTIRGGRSGSAQKVVRADRANDEPEFYMTSDHVNYQNYSYLINLPQDSKIGVIMISGVSKFSVSEVFVRHFKKHIGESYGLISEIDRFVPKEALENIEKESKIDTIVLSKYDLSADSAEANLGLGFRASGLDIEVRIKGVNKYTKDIKGMIERWKTITGENKPKFLTSEVLDELGLIENERRVSFIYTRNGKRSTARSDNNFELKPYFYVGEEVIEYDEVENFPKLESVQTYMLNHLLPMIQSDLSR